MSLPNDHPYNQKPEPFQTDPNAPGAEKDGEHFDLERALEGLGNPLNVENDESHRSGYVNILGRPNVGKSTLLNALVGERMSIITAKPQTTRHRILALLSGEDFQAVFSDTPGLIEETHYKMQERMNAFVSSAFEDADVLLFVVVPQEEYEEDHHLITRLKNLDSKVCVVVNKTDTVTQEEADEVAASYKERIDAAHAVTISALNQSGTAELLDWILTGLPKGPAYYPKDQMTDRPERFFVTEIIREQILEQYYQEIPYAVEPVVEKFEETRTTQGKDLIRISAVIYVERDSQKNILIGKGGQDIKAVGSKARQRLESFFGKKVFLETRVKVRANWRNDEKQLKRFGYE
jgi:GTP-binding protein Era